ncbi:uncharacterized protein ACLA_070820 [Aspergillus clavatus NRRL 1]|uniref:Uncharacterized protein n=1 Tax=Aspergillus clavatus (strain ATCC 1007 / CBS 513.65 / DSM 816 / NCTC 3887 / NRRL 1 / QM 1276 / 107) TaxID=344612 RepID=A1C6M8_ASPCL|nr:uncharacterized protein ACLA_070820 [Aspergillus clavatus NRRL 1]EAW14049.1 conserved hypothetical protein [Aspergillus clavatus NRRL 1]
MFNPNIPITGHHGRPIVIDDNDDEDNGGMQVEYSSGLQHPQHGMMGYGHAPTLNPQDRIYPSYHAAIEQEKKIRSRLREERHAALSVLLDRELLTIQALANQETLPQARRRFLAKLMAPEDPDVAAAIRADRFIIHHTSSSSSSSSSSSAMMVSRRIVDVHETDDAGWRRPDTGAGAGASAASSPASSSRTKGKMTPDRARAKAKMSSGRQQQQQQQQRERERRRRWSGAEREDLDSLASQRFSP